MLPAFSPEEIDQLKRAAQMFEMILDTGAQTDEAYETLKDVYAKLVMPDELKRVTVRYAEYLLECNRTEDGISQLKELAEKHPTETEWRTRLAELGTELPAPPTLPAKPESPNTDADKERMAAQLHASIDREAAEAFRELRSLAKHQPAPASPTENDEDLDRAIDEAEHILSDLDKPATPKSAPTPPPPVLTTPAASIESTEVPPDPPTPVLETIQPVGAAAKIPSSEEPPERASAYHVEAKLNPHGTGSLEKELQRSLRLGEMLVEQGVITRENLEEALTRQRELGKQIGEVLIDLGYADEADVLNCLSLQAGVPYLPLELYEVQPELANLLPAAFARRHGILPVDVIANSVLITITMPLSRETKAELARLLGGRRVSYYISAKSEVEKKLDEMYPPEKTAPPAQGVQ